MCLLKALSKMLQSSTINWHQVCGEVRTLQNIIEGLCESQQYIDSCTIHRTRITDFCAKSTADSETTQTRIKKKTKQVCGIVGRYLSERFSASNMELLKGLSGLDPSSSDWLNFDILNALIEHYSVLGIRPSILRAEAYGSEENYCPHEL